LYKFCKLPVDVSYFGQQNEKFGLGMDTSSSDELIKYAPNRLGIALIAAGLIGLVLSVYAI